MTKKNLPGSSLDKIYEICKNKGQIESKVFILKMIRRNESLERMLVWAINKAVADDIPLLFSEHPLDTHNFLGHFRGDCINTNLRLGIALENVTILPFQRSGYAGRLVIDHANKISYSITTGQNLRSIPKKGGRRTPHFLQTLLGVENVGYEGECKQLSFMPMNLFDAEILQKDFDVIDSECLNEFVAPDYAELTDSRSVPDTSNAIPEPNVQSLIELKPGLRPTLPDEEDEA